METLHDSTKPRPADAYLRNRVLTASPEELRLMLLDGAVKFAGQGREGLATKNYEASFSGFSRCREIILELVSGIREDVDPELAKNVRGVYMFIYQQLVEGNHERDLAKIDRAIDLIKYERETWALLMRRLADERGRAGPAPAPAAVSLEG